MARTTSGCWTCRLRTKKKCDETKPTCQRCTVLGLRCLGYGARPSQDHFRDDRRAVIASVGALSRTEDSKFRVWRIKPKVSPGGERQANPDCHIDTSTIRQKKIRPIQQQPSHGGVLMNCSTQSLKALDRVNSGMLDFLHPQLLRNYTEEVFWLDSRFYESPGHFSGNTWLSRFLVQSKETRLAAALMGLTWSTLQEDVSRIIDIDFTRPLVNLHTIVIRNVYEEIDRCRTLVETEDVLAAGAILAKCATLLLIFEVWRTLEGDWIAYLRGMGDILHWVVSRAPAVINAATNIMVGGKAEDGQLHLMSDSTASNTTLNYIALKWALQAYTWNDVTAAIWIGPFYTHSRWNDGYGPLLENGYLQMEKYMGCEDHVLFALSQISRLEETIAHSAYTPSKDQTIDAAVKWDQILNAKLQNLSQRQRASSVGSESGAAYVTEMWVHAALVYLHIVTSGARWDHPKLRMYVARGLRAYIAMPRRYDIHIAMPFGVLASMASEAESQTVMRIAESYRTMEEINPGQRKTFKIVKECWRMREHIEQATTNKEVSWRDGARSLGLVLLPV